MLFGGEGYRLHSTDGAGTLLDHTYDTVVGRQQQYGRQRGVPWGVSESAFNARDLPRWAATFNYPSVRLASGRLIIFEGKDFLSNAWWISTFPGIAIVLTVVCLNLVGDGLRDAFDPRLKGSM